jgi:hypothetical protein
VYVGPPPCGAHDRLQNQDGLEQSAALAPFIPGHIRILFWGDLGRLICTPGRDEGCDDEFAQCVPEAVETPLQSTKLVQFTVENVSTPSVILTVKLADDSCDDWVLPPADFGDLDGYSAADFSLQFSPETETECEATLTIRSSADNMPDEGVSIPLVGIGIPLEVE